MVGNDGEWCVIMLNSKLDLQISVVNEETQLSCPVLFKIYSIAVSIMFLAIVNYKLFFILSFFNINNKLRLIYFH